MLTGHKEIRSQFRFMNEYTYIDAAHYTPYPLFVAERLKSFIDKFTTDYYNMSLFNIEFARELREFAARLINAEPDEIAVTGNATHGINIFANGIRVEKGNDRVAFIDSEFPSIVYAWMNQERLGKVKCFKIPSVRGYIKVDTLKQFLLENKINVYSISHVQFLGYKYDIKDIASFCRENNIMLLVDAIQSTGVNPIDVKDMGIGCLCTGNQKWFMSPAGVGFLYLSREYKEHIDPTFVSTINVQYNFENFLDYKLNFREDCAVYENSTPNTLGMIGFIEVLKYFIKLGPENIYNHIIELQDVLINELDRNKYRIESSLDPIHRSNILLISHNDISLNHIIHRYLADKKIHIALREKYLRISPHIYNDEDDMKKLAVMLNEFSE